MKPWQSRTPVLPPEWKKGSAPGITGMTAVLSRLRSPASSHATTTERTVERKEPAWRGHCPRGNGPAGQVPQAGDCPVAVWTCDHVSMFYWVVKAILGPLLAIFFRPWSEGAENVPREGPAILASNHLSFSDHFFGPLPLPRKVTFLAKSEYFTGRGAEGPGQQGLLQRRRADPGGPGRAARPASGRCGPGCACWPRANCSVSTRRAPGPRTGVSTGARPGWPGSPWSRPSR